jgi:hypothetical protein
MGRAATDGSFDNFVSAISNASLDLDGLSVRYEAPGHGEFRFGWEGNFTLGGTRIPLRDFPRWNNPYAQAGFNTKRFEIEAAGEKLTLDFDARTRVETRAASEPEN